MHPRKKPKLNPSRKFQHLQYWGPEIRDGSGKGLRKLFYHKSMARACTELNRSRTITYAFHFYRWCEARADSSHNNSTCVHRMMVLTTNSPIIRPKSTSKPLIHSYTANLKSSSPLCRSWNLKELPNIISSLSIEEIDHVKTNSLPNLIADLYFPYQIGLQDRLV